MPKGQQLDTCMCDGTERAICEFVKNSMKTLCYESPVIDEGSGSNSSPDPDQGREDDEDYLGVVELDSSTLPAAHYALTLLASILALLPLI